MSALPMIVTPARPVRSFAFGLAVTVSSDLPSLQLFGWPSGLALMPALAGDLAILPSAAILPRQRARRLGRRRVGCCHGYLIWDKVYGGRARQSAGGLWSEPVSNSVSNSTSKAA